MTAQTTVEDLNARIKAEFERAGEEYHDSDGKPVLYVQWSEMHNRLELCDYNTCVPISEQDALEGGIEQVARDWIHATA